MLVVVFAASCLISPAVPAQSGFVPLFDGKTTHGWHGFKRTDMPKGWSAKGGALTFTPGIEGGDISTDKVYGDFDFRFEWRISKGGNSGVMYRADESHEAAYLTGPEYQILDNLKHPDGRKKETSASSCYGLYAANGVKVKPVGQWNTGRIVARGNTVEHWLNGVRGVKYTIGSADWNKRMADSKFTAMIDFASLKFGHIVLQDHGDPVAYRNLRLKKL